MSASAVIVNIKDDLGNTDVMVPFSGENKLWNMDIHTSDGIPVTMEMYLHAFMGRTLNMILKFV